MKVLVNGTYVGIDIADTITIGSVVDARIVKLEQRVADYFDVPLHSLNDWRENSDAKLLLCFLLYHHCHYSISSIAKQYRIYKYFLLNCIRQEYERCLTDGDRKAFIDGFINDIGINKAKAS